MSWKRSAVQMPMASAGILGISQNTKTGEIDVSPKSVILLSVLFIVLIKVLDMLFSV